MATNQHIKPDGVQNDTATGSVAPCQTQQSKTTLAHQSCGSRLKCSTARTCTSPPVGEPVSSSPLALPSACPSEVAVCW